MSRDLKQLAVNLKEETINSKNWHVRIENNVFTYNGDSFIIDTQQVKQELSSITYPTLDGTWSLDAKLYNPIEADRPKNFNYWNKKFLSTYFTPDGEKVRIVFPLFNHCFWYLFHQFKRVPTFEEFAKTYLSAYLHPSIEISVKDAYFDNEEHCNLNINDQIKIGSDIFTNKHLHFIEELNVVLPINYVTTEQILYRLTKIYGSVARDLYHPVSIYEAGGNVLYDSTLDIKGGIDLIVDGVACFSYTNTPKATAFARDKELFRHSSLVKKDEMGDAVTTRLITDIGYTSGLVLPPDNVIKRMVDDIKSDNLREVYRY